MKIGVVDLDTSHPAAFIPIQREMGHEIVGVWDGGSIHPPAYVAEFAKEHDIPTVFDNLEEMASAVDCAIIHGCDWDTHIPKARPFVDAGKAVLLDKPLAGNPADLRQLTEWARRGARVTGGSALMYCNEVAAFLAQPESERGRPHTVFCGCGVDDFNYGIHAYALAAGLFGDGASQVRHMGTHQQSRIQIDWSDGRTAIVVIGEISKWIPFYGTVATDREAVQLQIETGALYRAFLEASLPYLAGETDTPPRPMDKLIEPELCALAALQSKADGGRAVALDELDGLDVRYDGPAFAEGYRRKERPPVPSEW